MSDDYTRALADARRLYAQAWADGTEEPIEAVEFTTEFVRSELREAREREEEYWAQVHDAKEDAHRARRQAFADAVTALRRHPGLPSQRDAIWLVEDLVTDGIEVRPEALDVCAQRHDLERYCSDIHCDRCLAVKELDRRYGREATNMALQRARTEGDNLRGQSSLR